MACSVPLRQTQSQGGDMQDTEESVIIKAVAKQRPISLQVLLRRSTFGSLSLQNLKLPYLYTTKIRAGHI